MRHAERGAARRRAGGVDRRRADRRAGRDARGAGGAGARRSSRDPERRDELGEAAAGARPRLHVGPHRRAEPRGARARRRGARARRCARGLRALGDRARPPGMAARHARPPTRSRSSSPSSSRACSASATTASLGALLSTFTILAVAGSALQVAVARETALGHLGDAGERRRDASTRWLAPAARRRASALTAVVGDPARADRRSSSPCPSTRGRPRRSSPPASLWLLLGVQRGALQGLHALRAGRAERRRRGVRPPRLRPRPRRSPGAGVTGAYLGTPLSMVARRGRARRAAAPQRRRRARRTREPRTLRSARRRRLGADRRPDLPRRAAERRRDRRQARDERRRGGRLRGGGRRGQARRVGGDRHRPVPAARGDAPRRGRRWTRGRCSCATLGLLGARRRPGAGDLRGRRRRCCCALAFGEEYTTGAPTRSSCSARR